MASATISFTIGDGDFRDKKITEVPKIVSIVVDNQTGNWLYLPSEKRFIPPEVHNVTILMRTRLSTLSVEFEAPPGYTQNGTADQVIIITVYDRELPPTSTAFGVVANVVDPVATVMAVLGLVNGSGAIDVGGTSQDIGAGVPGLPRNHFIVINPPSETESLWLRFDGDAADTDPASGSIELRPGDSFEWETVAGPFWYSADRVDYVPQGYGLSVVAATAGHKFTAYFLGVVAI